MSFTYRDHFFKKAKANQFVARSIFKLEEIDKRFKLLKKGQVVLDLGHFPGSWCQYAAKVVASEGLVIGLDLQGVNPAIKKLTNLRQFEKDFFDLQSLEDLGLGVKRADVVLSDMAPKTTGIKTVDQARSIELVEQVSLILPRLLKPGGNFVIKIFEGPDTQRIIKGLKDQFNKTHLLRPKATRKVSKEFFFIGQSFLS